jgi:arylsulfatase A-like enzyme
MGIRWASQGLQPDDGNTTLPAILRDAGYLTVHVGKAHLGAEETSGADPTALGFDINIGGSVVGLAWSYFPDYGGADRLPGLEAYWSAGTYLNEALTLEAEKTIDQAIASGRPFFLNMSHYAVHTPLEGEEDPAFLDNYASLPTPEDDYAAMLESVDASLGSLVAHLQNRGIADETLVVFVSDNGGLSHFVRYDSPNPEEPWHFNEHNRPLASGKGAALEGGIRVPMIVSWAGQDPAQPPVQWALPITPGAVSDVPVHSDDLFETLLRAAGVHDPEIYLQETDGVDLGPLLSGLPFSRGEALYFHYPYQWVGDVGTGFGIEPFTAMRDGRWKLIYYWSNRNWVLYDLEQDLGETIDISLQETGVVHSLGSRMIAWLEDVGAQVPRDAGTLVDEPMPQLPPPDCSDDYDQDGFSVCDGDCDDLDSAVNPDATEVCNSIDDDCNGSVDEDDVGEDTDGDGVHNLCDNCPGASNASQDDQDGDALGDVCDNCIYVHNPDQADLDDDSEGDRCDLDDGLIYVAMTSTDRVDWQDETGFDVWNLYRGDMDELKDSGVYTQETEGPGAVELALRICDIADPWADDSDVLPSKKVVFYLVTGDAAGNENSLGTNSEGTERPNSNACP